MVFKLGIAETKIQMFRKTPLYAFGNVCDQQRQHHKRSDGETTFRLTLYNVPNFETESQIPRGFRTTSAPPE